MLCGPTNRLEAPAMYSRADPAPANGDGAIYMNLASHESKLDVMTLIESLQKTVAAHPNRPFLGHRPIDADGVAGPYVWQTYGECATRIENLAKGLLKHAMVDASEQGHKFLGIYMKNRPEWVLSQYAAFFAGAMVVPIYDTLGATSTTYILNQTSVGTVVCTSSEVESLLTKASGAPTLRHIVLADVSTIEASLAERVSAAGLRLWTLTDIEAAGALETEAPPASAKPDDVCMLMYTSGTTGDPKGAMITHGNLNAVRYGMVEQLSMSPSVAAMLHGEPSVLSFLPLAHVAEQTMHAAYIYLGGAIGFSQGNTLKLVEDVQALRPTFFLAVPRLLNKMYDKITEGAAAAGGIKAWLFQTALTTKLANLAHGETSHAIYDALIFSKLKAKLGLDRCALLATGAAPLPAHVLSFFRVFLGCTCTELYGQTETTGATNLTDYRDLDAGTVGSPMVTADVKLVSVPDMGYNVTDTVHGEGDAAIAVKGRGEVCIRGPTVFPGYFNAPEKTAEMIDEDGWLHSGDIGVWTIDGRLKLVDRKKNIFKLSQGEYVAPEKIENVIQASPYIGQAFVHGDSLHASLVAIIVPEETALAPLAASLKVAGSFADWCKSPAIVDAILADIKRVSKAQSLLGFEIVRAVHLETEPFSVENDLMTPTFKLKRHEAKVVYSARLDELYTLSGDVVAGKQVMQH